MASCGQQQLVGGKRAPTKKAGEKKTSDKKTEKKTEKRTESKQDASKRSSSSSGSSAKRAVSKKGGAFLEDVKTLAVPFAILLAKESLGKVMKKDAAKDTMSPKNASKPSSSRRRTTLSGGSCNLGCGMSGGAAAKELFQLQNEIDRFLEKY
jgi:hypothetical protein